MRDGEKEGRGREGGREGVKEGEEKRGRAGRNCRKVRKKEQRWERGNLSLAELLS